jgi:hypothetical protein
MGEGGTEGGGKKSLRSSWLQNNGNEMNERNEANKQMQEKGGRHFEQRARSYLLPLACMHRRALK